MEMNDEGVTAPLGVILMMGITLTGALSAGAALNQWMDATTTHANSEAEWANAEAERARFYANCARAATDEDRDMDPGCPDGEWEDPLGYDCTRDAGGVVICKEQGRDGGLL